MDMLNIRQVGLKSAYGYMKPCAVSVAEHTFRGYDELTCREFSEWSIAYETPFGGLIAQLIDCEKVGHTVFGLYQLEIDNPLSNLVERYTMRFRLMSDGPKFEGVKSEELFAKRVVVNRAISLAELEAEARALRDARALSLPPPQPRPQHLLDHVVYERVSLR